MAIQNTSTQCSFLPGRASETAQLNVKPHLLPAILTHTTKPIPYNSMSLYMLKFSRVYEAFQVICDQRDSSSFNKIQSAFPLRDKLNQVSIIQTPAVMSVILPCINKPRHATHTQFRAWLSLYLLSFLSWETPLSFISLQSWWKQQLREAAGQ